MSLLRPLPAANRRVRHALIGVAATITAAGAVAVAVLTISADRVGAVWTIESEIGESSQLVPLRAAHPDCPSWAGLGGLVVHAVETDETVTITATFPARASTTPCESSGPSMRASVRLDRPLGDRTVVDGGTGLDPATPIAVALRTGQTSRED